MRILLVEDDAMIGDSLRHALRNAGMTVDWVTEGGQALTALDTGDYTLVLLDLGLPGLSGLDVLKRLRSKGNATPLLIITARDDLENRVAGLDLGADDYVVKPFEMAELMARMRAVLRRHHGHSSSVISNGEITLDLASHEATYRDKTLLLPAREFALLQALTERTGAILSRAQLEERLYGWGEEVESNAVDVLIHYLRKKFDSEIIRNVRGVGWMVAKSEP